MQESEDFISAYQKQPLIRHLFMFIHIKRIYTCNEQNRQKLKVQSTTD